MEFLRPSAMTNFNDGSRYEELKKSLTSAAVESEATNPPSVGFECNICLDLVQDPVVTLCGHLYCWPCIYKWINVNMNDQENADHHIPQCPVCKSEVSDKTVIPLYGRGQTTDSPKDKLSHLIPQRPPSPRCNGAMILPSNRPPLPSPLQRGSYALPPPPQQDQLRSPMAAPTTHLTDPMIGMFGEMVYARIFGNSEATLYTYPNSYHIAGSNTLRLRRRMMQTDKSLSRVCFFFCCCMLLCLVLF
ncbi:hypothetical protein ACS0TY_017441 [Phlomoides rotata]